MCQKRLLAKNAYRKMKSQWWKCRLEIPYLGRDIFLSDA